MIVVRGNRDLIDEGPEIGWHRVARLMHQNGLVARQKCRFRRSTDGEHACPVAPNLFDQDIASEDPDQNWGARGWLHLAVVISCL